MAEETEVLANLNSQLNEMQWRRLKLFFHLLNLGSTAEIQQSSNLLEFMGFLRSNSDFRERALSMLKYMLVHVGVPDTDLLTSTNEAFDANKFNLAYPSVVVQVCIDLDEKQYESLRTVFCQSEFLHCSKDTIDSCEALLLKLHQREKILPSNVELLIHWLEMPAIGRNDISKYVKYYANSGKYDRFPPGSQRVPTQEVSTAGPYFAHTFWKLDGLIPQKGQGVLIAVLDTGINTSHKAFQPIRTKLKETKNFVSVGLDNCRDTDPLMHGTGVAGVAAGKHLPLKQLPAVKAEYGFSDNMMKIPLSVAPEASLVVCRVGVTLDQFHPDAVAKALNWIYEHNLFIDDRNPSLESHSQDCSLSHVSDEENKIRIVSMSFRLDSDYPQIKENLEKLKSQGVICIASVGNDGKKKPPGWPALYKDLVLTVGSCDYNSCIAGHSTTYASTDSKYDCVNVYALGVNVLLAKNGVDGFHVQSGTSFAAPAVAGLVAVLLQCARESKSEKAIKVFTNLEKLVAFFNEYMGAKHERLLPTYDVSGFFSSNVCGDESTFFQNFELIANNL